MHKINNLARLCERANWTDSDVHCSAYVSHRMFPSWRFSLRPAWSHGESLLILWVIFGWLIWERRDRCVMIAGQSFQEIKKHIVSRSMCLSISCQLWLFKTCGPGPANIPRIGWYGMIWRIYSNPLWLTILVGSKPDKHHGTNQQISPPTSCEPQKSAPRQALLRDPAGYELCLVADLDMAATPATSHARRELFSGSWSKFPEFHRRTMRVQYPSTPL